MPSVMTCLGLERKVVSSFSLLILVALGGRNLVKKSGHALFKLSKLHIFEL